MATDSRTNGNGKRVDFWTKLMDPRTVIALVVLAVGIGGWFFAVQGHCANTEVHHKCDELDRRYVNEETYKIQRDNLEASLRRIERRLDKISDKLNVQ